MYICSPRSRLQDDLQEPSIATLISDMSSPAPALQAPPQTWETSGNGNNAEAGPSHTTAHDQTNGNTTTMTTDRAPDLPERPGDMGANVNGESSAHCLVGIELG
jgi:hypothetical protein